MPNYRYNNKIAKTISAYITTPVSDPIKGHRKDNIIYSETVITVHAVDIIIAEFRKDYNVRSYADV